MSEKGSTDPPTRGSSPPPEPPSEPPSLVGKSLHGRYTFTARLGEGAMGQVYVARQHSVSRNVAIKVINPNDAKTYQFPHAAVERFLREASVLATLDHPGIVKVIESEQDEHGYLYLVMELLQGVPLDEYLWRQATVPVSLSLEEGKKVPYKGLDLDRALIFIRGIAEALGAVHERRVLHRDLKPANIMIVSGARSRPVLIDFGLVKSGPTREDVDIPADAKTIMTNGHGTMAGEVFGTLAYMPPEQLLGRIQDSTEYRVDLYALACILYQMLVGFTPYEHLPEIRANGNDLHPWMAVHYADRPLLPASQLRPDLPAWVDAFLEKALARDPARRFQSAQEFLDGLGTARTTDPEIDSLRFTPPFPEPRRRHYVLGGVALFLAFLVLAGLWGQRQPVVSTPVRLPDARTVVPAPTFNGLPGPVVVPDLSDAALPIEPPDAMPEGEDAAVLVATDAVRTARPARPHRRPPTPRCGHLDPLTGTRVPCF